MVQQHGVRASGRRKECSCKLLGRPVPALGVWDRFGVRSQRVYDQAGPKPNLEARLRDEAPLIWKSTKAFPPGKEIVNFGDPNDPSPPENKYLSRWVLGRGGGHLDPPIHGFRVRGEVFIDFPRVVLIAWSSMSG